MKTKPFFFLLMIIGQAAFSQDKSLFTNEVFKKGSETLLYRIMLPENFDSGKKYPVVLFLHGAGERGSDNEAQLTHGAKLFLDPQVRKDFPAIVVFPQCPKDSYWSNVKFSDPASGSRFNFQKGGESTMPMELLLGLVRDIRSRKYTDDDRFYVAGLSMGGMGTYEILRRKPKWFAAGISICGGDNVENVKKYRKVPLWVFHGAKDDVVPPAESEKIVAELRKFNAPVRFTLYPNANHNSWDPAFAEPGLLSWLFSNSR